MRLPGLLVSGLVMFPLTAGVLLAADADNSKKQGEIRNRTLIIFKNAAALNRFIENGWDVGAGGGAGAAIEGKGAGGAAGGGFASETEVYTLTRTGLQAGFAAAGAKFWKDKDLN